MKRLPTFMDLIHNRRKGLNISTRVVPSKKEKATRRPRNKKEIVYGET